MNRDYNRIKRSDDTVCKNCAFYYCPKRINPAYDDLMYTLNSICKTCIDSGDDEYSMLLTIDAFDCIVEEKSNKYKELYNENKDLKEYYREVQEYAHSKQVDIIVQAAIDRRKEKEEE